MVRADAALINHADFPLAYLLRSQAYICEVGRLSLGPFIFQGAIHKTSGSGTVSKEDRALIEKGNAIRFQKAATDLEIFLKLAPNTPDAAMWKEQVETLRLYAEPAEKAEADRTVFIASDVTTKARILKKPEPSYSDSARNAQVEGTVVLRAVLTADGQVRNILVLSRLPYGLTERAIEAARKIKFQPAEKDGRPVSLLVQMEFHFNLY
jgi:TonB family protein